MSVLEDGYGTTLLFENAVRTVREGYRCRLKFLDVAYGAPDLLNETPHEPIALYLNIGVNCWRLYSAIVFKLDNGIGDIFQLLEDERIFQNAIIWFKSDNGGLSPEPSAPRGEGTLEFAMEQSRRSGIKLRARFCRFAENELHRRRVK